MTKPELTGSVHELLSALQNNFVSLAAQAKSQQHSVIERRSIDDALRAIKSSIDTLLQELDPIKQPSAVFDPSNPEIIGRFISLALVAQEPQQLASVEKFYGSGVYAIYYKGGFPLYAPIANSETPIYVGKASPAIPNARNPLEQGDRLARRLDDHRKNISKAKSTLVIDDFQCRFLVVQSGYETAAENFLIHLFHPIWNSETDILYGLGKHGDSADTRANRRSPWDTMHPGREWAAKTTTDARSKSGIEAGLEKHFAKTRVYKNLEEVLEEFLSELRQL